MSTDTHPPAADRRGPARRGGAGMDWFFRLLRWIGSHVRGFHAAVGVFLVAGLGVVLAGGMAFGAIARAVSRGRTQAIDESILRWVNAHASPALDVAALEVTALGGGLVVWVLALVSGVFLWQTKHRYSAALIVVALVGSGLINSSMKLAFDRPRPSVFEWRTTHVGLSSFPSGHAMTSMVVYATLAYLVARLEPTPLLRRLTYLLAGTIIVGIGLSRLYLGVHYPSDVLAGFTTGLAWAATCALGMEAVRYFRHRKPEVAQVEKDLNAEEERAVGVRE
ncbi:MAG TPA: phosphatase PAP2 family protein [Longimicrobium sp.]|nr:phosphatase PAP2 family protein [Longimicrobium sp.]